MIAQNQYCLQHHTLCQHTTSKSDFVPTRLIDVKEVGDLSVCLYEHKSLPAGLRYVTLSHCWGKSQPLKLLKSNVAPFRDSIKITTLPKTFQHAIDVTRRMKYRYIWIDSL
jgi:hypothetical protein